jgi:hypothetical protein
MLVCTHAAELVMLWACAPPYVDWLPQATLLPVCIAGSTARLTEQAAGKQRAMISELVTYQLVLSCIHARSSGRSVASTGGQGGVSSLLAPPHPDPRWSFIVDATDGQAALIHPHPTCLISPLTSAEYYALGCVSNTVLHGNASGGGRMFAIPRPLLFNLRTALTKQAHIPYSNSLHHL